VESGGNVIEFYKYLEAEKVSAFHFYGQPVFSVVNQMEQLFSLEMFLNKGISELPSFFPRFFTGIIGMSLYHLPHHPSSIFIYLLLFFLLKRRVLTCLTIPILLIKLLSTHVLHEITNKQTN